jgi:gas vesicle protein
VYPKGSDQTYRQRITRRSSRARDELLVWAKARDFRDRATEYLNRARLEPDGDVQRRFVDVAQHYRILAEAEASNAGRLGNERRGQAETSQSGSPNGSIEVQALRRKLQLFASQQTDQTVRSQCHAVDKKLAEVVEENHPPLRQVLARHVEQLEKAIRRSTTDSQGETGTANCLPGRLRIIRISGSR